MFNILIRTSGRPKFFDKCYQSIMAQTYKDYRVIVSDDGCAEYLKDYPVEVVEVKRIEMYRRRETHPVKKRNCFWNSYMNSLLRIASGWVIYLDDDVTMEPTALEEISQYCNNVRNVIVWKYRFASGRVIPEELFWGKEPVRKHIDTGCFCHHSVQRVWWDSRRAADFRVIRNLWRKRLKFIWIDEVLFEAGNNGDIGKKHDFILPGQIEGLRPDEIDL